MQNDSPDLDSPAAGELAPNFVIPSKGYRNAALDHYKRLVGGFEINVCVMCGFGIRAVLEVAHLDQDRKNNDLDNLAVLCPNCHKMHDIRLIPKDVVKEMRDFKGQAVWGDRMKDAAQKAAATRRLSTLRKKRSVAGKKAAATRATRMGGGSGT